ncbi:MAG TPA: hypothetical protein DD723_03550 [Candidatus Omnitrophica bacterium]|nr:MAG: hypothetical protein A2Z81_00725 [Omnitrophica WOR_2 bacterium GWA2_45_18]HBR14606.1 hypothetical protein [Candidatus Omnitrophota bacterium]
MSSKIFMGVFIIGLIILILFMNNWVAKELDVLKKTGQPSRQAPSNLVESEPQGSPLPYRQAVSPQPSNPVVVPQEPAVSVPSPEKEKKIIYEFPLDDVILVQ